MIHTQRCLGFKLLSKIAISFLFVFLIGSPLEGYSQELNQNQQEFSNSIDAYNKLRARQIKHQAQVEELKKSEEMVVAQRFSDDETETQDERIEQLERKLQSVTQELQDQLSLHRQEHVRIWLFRKFSHIL